MNFRKKLEKNIKKNNSLLSIGLDPDVEKIPEHLKKYKDPIFNFNKQIVDATYDLVCAYKPQIAHYAAKGIRGIGSLLKTINYLAYTYPQIPIILDAKRADIESTSRLYAKEAFDVFNADALTVNPYFGLDSLKPFLERKDKGVIILCKTSNKSAGDFQDLKISSDKIPLYLHVAEKVQEWNKKYKNCMLVVGATWPEELKKIREIAPNMFFLVPGIGSQGGDIKQTLKNGLRKDKSGLIIHASRSIIYASDKANFAITARKEALKLKENINKYR
ncbi:MAG: orotidine-5'-phosphate decarboxylase [Candidatus Levybacteria bacterium]|nr:orotidine-5'-phosphate decarboxylase [Candidatus Levybacteria bacterium]